MASAELPKEVHRPRRERPGLMTHKGLLVHTQRIRPGAAAARGGWAGGGGGDARVGDVAHGGSPRHDGRSRGHNRHDDRNEAGPEPVWQSYATPARVARAERLTLSARSRHSSLVNECE